MTGKEAQSILESIRITTNKNTIPNDSKSPFVTSGLRLGTPAVTSRGMKEEEMVEIADIINMAIERTENESILESRVIKLSKRFPLY